MSFGTLKLSLSTQFELRTMFVNFTLVLIVSGIDLYFDSAASINWVTLIIMNSALVFVGRITQLLASQLILDLFRLILKLPFVQILLYIMLYGKKSTTRVTDRWARYRQEHLFNFFVSMNVIFFMKNFLITKYGLYFDIPAAIILLEVLAISVIPFMIFQLPQIIKIVKTRPL